MGGAGAPLVVGGEKGKVGVWWRVLGFVSGQAV